MQGTLGVDASGDADVGVPEDFLDYEEGKQVQGSAWHMYYALEISRAQQSTVMVGDQFFRKRVTMDTFGWAGIMIAASA